MISAALSFPFDKCVGIELLSNLHSLAEKLYDNLNNQNNNDYQDYLLCKKDQIFFIANDFIKYEYQEHDVFNNTSLIFINCKTFTKNLMQEIARKYSNINKGAYLITSFQNMEEYDPKWKNIEVLRRVMSWGPASLYINYKEE